MKYKSSIFIDKPEKDVFALVSGLHQFNDWLPAHPGYLGTELTSELPIAEGSTYKVITPDGFRDGIVETFEPPNRIVYKETLKFPVVGTLIIKIEYTLTKEGKGTNLERNLVIDAPLLLKPVLMMKEGALKTAIDKFMKVLKAEVEKE